MYNERKDRIALGVGQYSDYLLSCKLLLLYWPRGILHESQLTKSRLGYCFMEHTVSTVNSSLSTNPVTKKRCWPNLLQSHRYKAEQCHLPVRLDTEPHDGPKNDTHPCHAVSLLKIQSKPKQWYCGTRYIRITYIHCLCGAILNCLSCLYAAVFACPVFQVYKKSTLQSLAGCKMNSLFHSLVSLSDQWIWSWFIQRG